MRYTFGPVNSRRFGLSLGIDLSPDQKSCNFDCVYCELSGAKPTDKISNPPKVKEVIKEVKESLCKFPDIKVITITSNGEPTLYEHLDELVNGLNKIKEDKKLLILTNSSTICDEKVQKALLKIDIVKFSLDCASTKCFKKIDRPLKGIDITDITKCMVEFSNIFTNTLIVEILVVKGINDNKKEMREIYQVLKDIKPHRVDIGTIDRPPAYKVEAVDEKKLEELSHCFDNIAISLIRKNIPDKKENFSKEEILNLLSHRPQSEWDIEYFFSEDSKKILEKLLFDHKIIKEDIAGVAFYTTP